MRYAIVFALFLTFFFTSRLFAVAVPPTINVAAGESIQKAIDSAPDGATIHIAAGTFPEHLVISKPLTLTGAGWDKTIIRPDKLVERTKADEDAFFKRLDAAKDRRERMRLAMEITQLIQPSTLIVKSANGVTINDLKIQGMPLVSDGRELGPDTLIQFESAHATMNHCAVVGPFMSGVAILSGSDVMLDNCLVAGFWGTGVQIYRGDASQNDPINAKLTGCDIRNCYLRGVTINAKGVTVEKCRISGSAWHGIRYDDCSPTIVGNFLFGNARFGIYASGQTNAVVRDNVFAKNEMSGMSCWSGNADLIENNTFADNLRAGLEILGSASPSVSANTFLRNPVAIDIGKINGEHQSVSPDLKLTGNTFWKNGGNLTVYAMPKPDPAGSTFAEPKLADDALIPTSLWPIQPEEQAMIPDSATRDYSKWKTVAQK